MACNSSWMPSTPAAVCRPTKERIVIGTGDPIFGAVSLHSIVNHRLPSDPKARCGRRYLPSAAPVRSFRSPAGRDRTGKMRPMRKPVRR